MPLSMLRCACRRATVLTVVSLLSLSVLPRAGAAPPVPGDDEQEASGRQEGRSTRMKRGLWFSMANPMGPGSG